MTKHVLMSLLMVVAVAGSIQAQGLLPRRTLEGSRIQRQMGSAELLASTTNAAERARIELRIKNGELPEPLIPIEKALALAEKGDGKGYYQLAVRYAKGDGVNADEELAVKFLKESYDTDYPRAVLAVAFALEYGLVDWPVEGLSWELSRIFENVVGARFNGGLCAVAIGVAEKSSWKHFLGAYGSVTNAICILRVRQEYEHASTLGMTVATNELERFNKRMFAIEDKLADSRKRDEVKRQNDLVARKLMAKVSGVTQPFIPFTETEKTSLAEAVEKAKNGDAVSYYWLAYYFAKGEGVDRDGVAALKFLKKAVDANDPMACYTFGLLLEDEALQDEDGRSVGDQETSRGFGGLHFNLGPFGAAAWYSPTPRGYRSGNKCLTNTVAVAHVESLYQKAINGGFPYATNDIARLHKKITDCKKRIAERQMEKARREEAANKAQSLLDAPTKMSEEDKAAELWRSWPTGISDEEQMDIRAQAERKFNCVLMSGPARWCSTNSWRVGQGTSCIIMGSSRYGHLFQKIDASGKIIGISRSNAIDYDTFEEVKWIDDQISKRIDELQEKWAKEHNMTVDEAKEKYAKWEERHSLQARLARMNQIAEKRAKQQRDAKDAAEK